MKAAPILAVLIGTFLACVIAVVAVILFHPHRVRALEGLAEFGHRSHPVHGAEFSGRRSLEMQRPPIVKGMLLSRDFRPDPLDEPLVSKDIGSKRMTAFAQYSGGWAEQRSLFFFINDQGLIRVDVRYDTDCGSFVGEVNEGLSNARLLEDELWFDLTVTMLDGFEHVERWQGKLSLN